MKRRSLIFEGPQVVTLQEEEVPGPGRGQAGVRVLMTAISPGTEMLVYRGKVPQDLALDATIPSLAGTFQFPFKYGYASVGEVVSLGEGVDSEWLGKKVFSFHPHESAYCTDPSELMEIPDGIPLEDALFLPNMETAVNFVMDGRPILGEAAAVFGLGIIGLLTTVLLARFPLVSLVTFDRFPRRRAEALALGATASFDPGDVRALSQALTILNHGGKADGADLAFEVSGSPQALNQAIAVTGFDGRIVIGSWYGNKPVELDLGGRFHRSRIRLVNSQVSTIGSELSGRWSKPRRLSVAWDWLREIHPARWITHRFPFEQAPQAYRLLAERPEEAIQVIMTY